MSKYSFKTIEQMLLKCVIRGGEPELGFRLRGAQYLTSPMRIAARFKGVRTNPAQTRAVSGISPRCENFTPRRR